MSRGQNVLANVVKNNVSVADYFYNIVIPNMPSYYDTEVNFDAKPTAKCPLHDEDTASFRYYEETNSFYCFGCRAGGNVINLHMKFYERINGTPTTYDEAVRFLYNYFLLGREHSENTVQANQKKDLATKEQLNSNEDVFRFKREYRKVTDLLMFDSGIPFDKKEKAYKMLDDLDCLVSLDFVEAMKAREYLKTEFKELISNK